MTLLATTRSELLRTFNEAGVLDLADVHTGEAIGRMCRVADERVWLACALAVRALRAGSVCVDLATVAQQGFERDEEQLEVADLPWPEPGDWLAALAAAPAMVGRGEAADGTRPLRLLGSLLYLERYWAHEESVRALLHARFHAARGEETDGLAATLAELFDGAGLAPDEPDLQRLAAATAATSPVTVIAGGPGTGKTTTVARLLCALLEGAERPPRIALAAPTGKAAARLTESLQAQVPHLPERFRDRLGALQATTLHRLLGSRPDSRSRFRRDAQNPLAVDVVVVDEMSMVALTLMDRLLQALPASAKLIMVGDPDQLASVEAGAVLADIVRAGPPGIVALEHNWRFGSAITALAAAIRGGDADAALAVLTRGGEVSLVETDLTAAEPTGLEELHAAVAGAGGRLVGAARDGDAAGAIAALDEHRLLCGHRTGPFGVARWSWQAERWLADLSAGPVGDEFYVGRPLLVGSNLREIELYNGDAGVVVATPAGPRAAFLRGRGPVLYSPTQLSDVATLHAMTVHKSQGSQFGTVSLILPPVGSPLLTRELLYTAVTRAEQRVVVYGSAAAVAAAIANPARRATGLASRLD